MADEPHPKGAPPPGLELGEKIVVLAGGVIASMALTVLNPVLPAIEQELAHTATDRMLVKQLFGAVTLAMVIGAPIGGFLVARLGMRRLLLVASLVYAIAGCAGLFLSSLPPLLVSRMFVGASAACIQVMSLTLVTTRLDAAGRAKWMGLHVSIAIFCSLLIFPLAGFLGDISWRLPFLIYLFGLVVFVALLFSRERAGARQSAPERAAAAATDDGPLLRWMPWHYVALSFVVGLIAFLPTIYTPYLLVQRLDVAPSQIALIFTGSALLGGISALLYSRVRRHISIHVTFLCACAMTSLGMMIFALAQNLVIMLAGFGVYSIGNSWFVPNVMTSLGGKLKAHQHARANGLVKAASFLSTPIMVILVAPYAEKFGAATVMLIAASLAAFIFVLIGGRMVALRRENLVAEPVALTGR